MAWKIITATIENNNEVVLFNEKLPPHYVRCTGIACSVVDEMVRDGKVKGELSLSLNNRQLHPIHWQVESQEPPIGKQHAFLPLDEPLTPNTLLTGYFMDRSNNSTFQPYRIQVYLKCLKKTC